MSLIQALTVNSGKLAIRKRWKAVAQQTLALESEYSHLDGESIRKAGLALRYEVLSGRPLREIMARAFALVREAAHRNLGMRHYPVQLIGGAAMFDGVIAVMQTGEGKTLTATLPLFMAALSGRGRIWQPPMIIWQCGTRR